MQDFTTRVLDVVTTIPKGCVMSYGDVATKAGSAGAGRAVGQIMAKNSDKNIPCHRVVRSDGHIGAYNGLRGASKEKLLMREGVLFTQKKTVDQQSYVRG